MRGLVTALLLFPLLLAAPLAAQRTTLTLLKGDTVVTRYEPKTDSVVRVTTTRLIMSGKCGQSFVQRYQVTGPTAHRLSVDTLVVQVCAPPPARNVVVQGCSITPAARQDSMRKYGIVGNIGLDRQQDSLWQSWACRMPP